MWVWGAPLSSFGQQVTDAAFIKIDPKLGKVIYHRVLKNQTLYSVARGYGVSERSIRKANPGLRNSRHRAKLPPLLVVPISNDDIVTRLPLFRNRQEFLPVYYQVKKKENLFRICRRYFDIPTNLIVKRNDLVENKINEGQVLHIGWLKKDLAPLKVHVGKIYDGNDSDRVNPSDSESRFREMMQGTNLVSKNEVAFWKSSEQVKGMFIMHRLAEKSSIIEINNPMNDQIAYAKVIGTIPPHLYPEEVDMVISKDVAQALGAVDPKFFVRSRYKAARSISSR